MGGLGNQLFQYAAGRSLAERHATSLKFDLTLLEDKDPIANRVSRNFELDAYRLNATLASREEIRKYNPAPSGILNRARIRMRKALSPLRVYIQPSHGFDSMFDTIPDEYCLTGSFQSEKYFSAVSGLIRKELTLKKEPDPKSVKLLDEIRSINSCAMHIRRGDYITNPLYSKLLGTKEAEYFFKGLSVIRENEKPDKIFIFSDDINWCRVNLKFDIPVTFVDAENASLNHHIQLLLMSNCKHFIIPNSTYGWWGAWLSSRAGKMVVAPENWFAERGREEKDIIPDSWLRI